jgi:hypothetical protein
MHPQSHTRFPPRAGVQNFCPQNGFAIVYSRPSIVVRESLELALMAGDV